MSNNNNLIKQHQFTSSPLAQPQLTAEQPVSMRHQHLQHDHQHQRPSVLLPSSPPLPPLCLSLGACISPIAALQSPSASRATAPLAAFTQQAHDQLIHLLHQPRIKPIFTNKQILDEIQSDEVYALWYCCDGMMDVLQFTLLRLQQQHVRVDNADKLILMIKEQRYNRRLPSLSTCSPSRTLVLLSDTLIRHTSEPDIQQLEHDADAAHHSSVTHNSSSSMPLIRHIRTSSTPFLPNIATPNSRITTVADHHQQQLSQSIQQLRHTYHTHLH